MKYRAAFRTASLTFLLLFWGLVWRSSGYGQTPEWVVFDAAGSGLPDDQVQAIAVDAGGQVWVGTAAGLARFDGHAWTSFTPSGSGLPDPYVTAVAVAPGGDVWAGTPRGAARFDGTGWTTYTAATSPLPHDEVTALHADAWGRLWIGTPRGLAEVDGAAWTVHDSTNSLIFEHNLVHSISVDTAGTVWVGTFDVMGFEGSMLRYDGAAWQRRRLSQLGLPSSRPYAIAADTLGVVWIGASGTSGGALVRVENETWTVYGSPDEDLAPVGLLAVALEGRIVWVGTSIGLLRFDGRAWRLYDPTNSGLPDAVVTAIAVDGYGNKWIGTLGGGVAVFREGGVATTREAPVEAPQDVARLDNYPNPYRGATQVRFRLATAGVVSLRVYDVLGREVAVLVDAYRPAGTHEVTFDASGLPAGVYFVRLTGEHFAQTRRTLLVR